MISSISASMMFRYLFLVGILGLNKTTIVPNQTDGFQDGTLGSWVSGGSNPNPPVVAATGGIGGAGDQYMRLKSTGGGGAGSKLVVQTTSRWIGDYATAGITTISMHLKNEGSSPLLMRLVVIGAGGTCVSATPVSVPVGSGWIPAVFSLQQNAMVVTGTYSAIVGAVGEVRLLHNSAAATTGESIAAQLGVDNITAGATPLNVDEEEALQPGSYSLEQNYPNPFNPTTTIEFSAPHDGHVTLTIWNTSGQSVSTLFDGEVTAGNTQRAVFDARNLAGGMYFSRLETGGKTIVRKMLLLK